MDHQTAHLMEFTTDPIQTTTIDSAFTHEEKEQTLSRSENLMHNKEQHERGRCTTRLIQTKKHQR